MIRKAIETDLPEAARIYGKQIFYWKELGL